MIGRVPGKNDLVIEADTVSRKHAVIEMLYNEPAIRDLNSTNGTYVNDIAVTALPTPLKSGDVIRLGKNERLLYRNPQGGSDEDVSETRIFMDNVTMISYPGSSQS